MSQERIYQIEEQYKRPKRARGVLSGLAVLLGLVGLVFACAMFMSSRRILISSVERLGGKYGTIEGKGDYDRNVTWINLASTRVTDDDLSVLGRSRELRGVYLAYTDVTDLGLMHVKQLKHLLELNLNHTRVSDAGLEIISGYDHIEILELVGTGVTDDGIRSLGGLTNLVLLDVRDTRTTAEGREWLKIRLPDVGINAEKEKSETAH